MPAVDACCVLFRDEILSTVSKNQVVLIAGETGCGKTTQVRSGAAINLLSGFLSVSLNLVTEFKKFAAPPSNRCSSLLHGRCHR